MNNKVCFFKIQCVSKQMQLINMIMIYYRDKFYGGHLEHVL